MYNIISRKRNYLAVELTHFVYVSGRYLYVYFGRLFSHKRARYPDMGIYSANTYPSWFNVDKISDIFRYYIEWKIKNLHSISFGLNSDFLSID